MSMSCIPPKHSEVIEFTLHCETKTLYLQTRTGDGKIKEFRVDLTPLFTNCDGEDIFPMIDTRLGDPRVSEPNDGKVRVTFDIINVATGDVLGTEFFYVPVGEGVGEATSWGEIIGDINDQTDLGKMAQVNDAPSDGQVYGRKDGAWVVVTSGGSGLPPGGSAGDVLNKASATDGDARWSKGARLDAQYF